MRITPVVSYNEADGITEPNSNLFSRNAREFFSLRSPSSGRHREMLYYLKAFYDISFVDSPSNDEDADEDAPKNPNYNTQVVDLLAESYASMKIILLSSN